MQFATGVGDSFTRFGIGALVSPFKSMLFKVLPNRNQHVEREVTGPKMWPKIGAGIGRLCHERESTGADSLSFFGFLCCSLYIFFILSDLLSFASLFFFPSFDLLLLLFVFLFPSSPFASPSSHHSAVPRLSRVYSVVFPGPGCLCVAVPVPEGRGGEG